MRDHLAFGDAHPADHNGKTEFRQIDLDLDLADADFADGGSDRFVDEMIAWGDVESIRARMEAALNSATQRAEELVGGEFEPPAPQDAPVTPASDQVMAK